MLAYSSPPMHQLSWTSRPSPLVTRDANSCSLAPRYSSRMSTCDEGKGQPRRRESKYAGLLRKKDDQELRRTAFVRNARKNADDRRYEVRAEQTLRIEWLEEKRRWEAEKLAEEKALLPDKDVLEEGAMHDMEDLGMEATMDDYDPYDYVLSQEEQEYESMLPSMTQEKPQNQLHMPDLWSDDDEMDLALDELAAQMDNQTSNLQRISQTDGDTAMT